MRGSVRVWPRFLGRDAHVLDAEGGHVWHPVAPRARVEVACTHPAIGWSGDGYLDHNRGGASLESGFRDWIWSRAPHGDGAVVLYDGVRRTGERFDLGLRFASDGTAEPFAPPPVRVIPSTRWRMARDVRSEGPARLVRTLEDAPFYARSAIGQRLLGEDVVGVHETLSLDRFRHPLVQAMLPFRMPRRR